MTVGGGGQVLPALREHDLRPGAQGLQGHSGHPLRDTHTHTHTHTLRPFYQCSAVDGPGSNLGPLCYLEDKAFNDYKQIKLLLTV